MANAYMSEPIQPSGAEHALWRLLDEEHPADPETLIFRAEAQALLARALGVSVEDLQRPEDGRRLLTRKERNVWRGPWSFTLRLPDEGTGAEARQVTLDVRRAWPGTVAKQWCLIRRIESGRLDAGGTNFWYFDELTRDAVWQAAAGERPDRGFSLFRKTVDAYGFEEWDATARRLNQLSGDVGRPVERLAPEAGT